MHYSVPCNYICFQDCRSARKGVLPVLDLNRDVYTGLRSVWLPELDVRGIQEWALQDVLLACALAEVSRN